MRRSDNVMAYLCPVALVISHKLKPIRAGVQYRSVRTSWEIPIKMARALLDTSVSSIQSWCSHRNGDTHALLHQMQRARYRRLSLALGSPHPRQLPHQFPLLRAYRLHA